LAAETEEEKLPSTMVMAMVVADTTVTVAVVVAVAEDAAVDVDVDVDADEGSVVVEGIQNQDHLQDHQTHFVHREASVEQ